jgi:low temperature requirement protein LtrA
MIDVQRFTLLFGWPKIRREKSDWKVSWLELYFDLFFVATIWLIAHTFAHHLWEIWEWKHLIQLVLQVTAVRRLRCSITYFFERFTATGLTKRLFFFVIMFLVAGMALTIEWWLADMWMYFFAFYGWAKFLLGSMFLRWRKDLPHELRYIDTLNIIANYIAAIWSLLLFFVPWTWVPFIFVWSLFLDVFIPFFHRRASKRLPSVGTEKFNERFGLFVIIVLWEAIIAVISGIDVQSISPELISVAAGALVLNFGHRWLYFDFINRSEMREDTIYVRAYLHLPLVITYTMIWAVLLTLINHLHDVPEYLMMLLTILAMTVVSLIILFTYVVGNNKNWYEQSSRTRIELLVSVIAMWVLLLLQPEISVVHHIWILSWLVFLPIVLRIWARLSLEEDIVV